MRRLPLLRLLCSAALLCTAALAAETFGCTEDGVAAAARLALREINRNHHHGYKFRLKETEGNKVERVGEGCNIELQLKLLETKCHVLNPKPFGNCSLREPHSREVAARCNVTAAVSDGDANVTRYSCKTQQVKTNVEMMSICPDCVTLLPLNNTEGLKSVNEAVRKFNQNTTNKNYYILKEVGRISSGYMMTTGMNYYAEFALVETHCPMGSRIIPEACIPRCPDRARHAFCTSSYSKTNGLLSPECEFYPAVNTTELAPGEKEQMCRHPHHHHHHHHRGPPPHAHDHGQGPPPHAGQGPPPHAGQGPPPHAHSKDQKQGPPSRGRDHEHGPPSRGKDHEHGPPSRGKDHEHQDHEHGPPSRGKDHEHQDHEHGPPSRGKDHEHGPPSRGKDHEHQDHEHGPPSRGKDHEHGPPSRGPPSRGHHKFDRPCHGFLADVDPALHPICPWPFPEHHHKPNPHQP